MFKAKTVFIVGAGASFELGFPLGSDLLKTIASRLDIKPDMRPIFKDNEIDRTLRVMTANRDVGKSREALKACALAGRKIAKSSVQSLSIDNLIDNHEDDYVALMGKIGIVKCILDAEYKSKAFSNGLHQEKEFDLKIFEKTWLLELSKLLIEQRKKSDLDQFFSNVSFINFNYDRSIEQFFPFAISTHYGISLKKSRKIVRDLTMHRPYGSIGALPWMHDTDKKQLEYGQSEGVYLPELSGQIQTFTERVSEGNDLDEIRREIKQADRIFFLGFGFHRQNIELLKVEIQRHAKVYATTHGVSESDKIIIRDEIATAFSMQDRKDKITFSDLKCYEFFSEFWRTMTAGSAKTVRIDN